MLRDQEVHEYVVVRHRNLRHDLERIGETHESRPLPVLSYMSERERAVVETRAVSDARTAAVEAHAGAENGVEKTRSDPCVAVGFVHSEGVLPRLRAERHEAHAPRAHAD